MRHYYGWWDFDPEGPALINRFSGQRVGYAGPVEDEAAHDLPTSPNRRWMRFEYSDAELIFPVLVEWRNVPGGPGLRRNIAWRVDYQRSAAPWRRQASGDSSHPPYGLWRRLDDCLTDALGCWPELEVTGPEHEHLALSGGWHNGAWTQEIYRECPVLTETKYVLPKPPIRKPWVAPLDLPAPTPWHFVPAEGRAVGASLLDWGFERLADGRLHLPPGRPLQGVAHDRPYLRSANGTRYLIPLFARGNTATRKTWEPDRPYVTLLLVDEQIVCDSITAGNRLGAKTDAIEWDLSIDVNTMLVGVQQRDATGSPIPGEEVPPVGLDDSEWRHWTPSDKLARRLSCALNDAWPNWLGTTVTLPLWGTDNAREFTLPGVAQTNSYFGLTAGVEHETRRMHASYALDEAIKGRRNPMRFMFDEEDDGILRVTARSRHFGWWDFDPEGPALVNRKSEQRVRFDGAASACPDLPPSSGDEDDWWRFTYTDKDVTYPLLVRRPISKKTKSLEGPWQLDHLGSAALWRHESGASPDHPPYGLWRRVDECLCDALRQWPEINQTGTKASRVKVLGGWLNGAWHAEFERELSIMELQDSSHKRSLERPLAEPIMERLDSATPPPWHFVPAPEVARHATITGMEHRSRDTVHLSPDALLEGFEHHMPHLRRADGRAVMLPSRIQSFMGGRESDEYTPSVEFIYADEDMVLTVIGHGYRIWNFSIMQIRAFGPRRSDKAHDMAMLANGDGSRLSRKRPSYPLWRRLSQALTDGWLQWSGADQRLLDSAEALDRYANVGGYPQEIPEEKSGISLERKEGSVVSGGYSGGLYLPFEVAQSAKLRVGVKKPQIDKDALEARLDSFVAALVEQTGPKPLPPSRASLSRRDGKFRMPRFRLFGRREDDSD